MLSAGASHHPFNTLANILSHNRLVVSQMLCSGQLHHAAPRGWGCEDILITLNSKLAYKRKSTKLKHSRSESVLWGVGFIRRHPPPRTPPPRVYVCAGSQTERNQNCLSLMINKAGRSCFALRRSRIPRIPNSNTRSNGLTHFCSFIHLQGTLDCQGDAQRKKHSKSVAVLS